MAPSSLNEAHGSNARDEALVTIILQNVPDGGVVYVDDESIEGTILRLDQNGVVREVRVDLPYHEPWRRVISPQIDRTYSVKLVPIDEDDSKGKARGGFAKDRVGAKRENKRRTHQHH